MTVNKLNPASLMPADDLSDDFPHDCLQVLDAVYSSRPDLTDQPLQNAELELFIDGSSYVLDGQ